MNTATVTTSQPAISATILDTYFIKTDELQGSTNFPGATEQPTDEDAIAKGVSEGACRPVDQREVTIVSWASDENGFYAGINQYNRTQTTSTQTAAFLLADLPASYTDADIIDLARSQGLVNPENGF